MSDNAMTMNLQSPVFNGKEEEWPKIHDEVPGIFSNEGMH